MQTKNSFTVKLLDPSRFRTIRMDDVTPTITKTNTQFLSLSVATVVVPYRLVGQNPEESLQMSLNDVIQTSTLNPDATLADIAKTFSSSGVVMIPGGGCIQIVSPDNELMCRIDVDADDVATCSRGTYLAELIFKCYDQAESGNIRTIALTEEESQQDHQPLVSPAITKTLLDVFLQRLQEEPNNVCVISTEDSKQLTYRQVNQCSNPQSVLPPHLKVVPGDMVSFLLPRCSMIPIAILTILK
eukprot:PhF_6_TR7612/c1_g2_i1/m.11172